MIGGASAPVANVLANSVATLRFWCYDLGGNRLDVYSDGVATSTFGRVDGLSIKTLANFRTKLILTDTLDIPSGSMFGGFGVMGEVQLDSDHSGILLEAGEYSIGSLSKSTGISSDYGLQQTGGELTVGTFRAFHWPTGTTDMFQILGGRAIFGGGPAKFCPPNASTFYVASGGVLSVTGGKFLDISNQARAKAVVRQGVGGTLIALGNYFALRGSGTGDVISVAEDNYNMVAHNALNEWGMTLPAFTNNRAGTYHPNSTPGRVGPRSRTVPAGDPIAIIPNDQVVIFTDPGTNPTIGSIFGTYPGHRITLLFGGPCTIAGSTAGQELSGGRNFVAELGDTLELVYSGAKWREISRCNKAEALNREMRPFAFNGTFSGTGAVVAHGIPNLKYRVQSLLVMVENGSATGPNSTVFTIDDTSINIAGGINGAPYKVSGYYLV